MTLPSHASMLTGLLPPEHGVRNNAGFTLRGETVPSLPRLLKAQGYATGAAVSTYVLRHETGLGPLFDFYEDSVPTTPGVASVRYQRPGETTLAFAKEWISARSAGPFFLFFHVFEPHLPYEPAPAFLAEYGATYEAEIATADAVVGALLDHLRALGVYERAIVVVTSDHGEGLGDHGEEQHSLLLYREAIQVPLFLKLPGSRGRGSVVEAPVQLSDILPTVTALLGLPTPAGVSGRSLLASDAPGAAPRTIYGETLYPRLQLGWADLRSALDGRWHYIHGPRPELYDLASDPAEKNDLAQAHREVATRFARELLRFPEGNETPAPADEETLRKLAALGYLGGLRDRGGAEDLPNPVDNVATLRRLEEGWRLASAGRTEQAIEHLETLVAEQPGMQEAWLELAELRVDAGRDDEAAAAYRHVLGGSPLPLPDVAISLGFVELRRNRLAGAEALARGALGALPGKAHHLLGRVALARGDLAAAEREALLAVGATGGQPSAILALAEAMVRAGRTAEALGQVERAAARARQLRTAPVWNLEFVRGDALARANRLDEAEAAFRAEITAFPRNTQAFTSLAVLRSLKGDRTGVDLLLEAMYSATPTRKTALLAAGTLESLGAKGKAGEWRARGSSTRK
jgi:tetratricopeptide (TPR) repeat protein